MLSLDSALNLSAQFDSGEAPRSAPSNDSDTDMNAFKMRIHTNPALCDEEESDASLNDYFPVHSLVNWAERCSLANGSDRDPDDPDTDMNASKVLLQTDVSKILP